MWATAQEAGARAKQSQGGYVPCREGGHPAEVRNRNLSPRMGSSLHPDSPRPHRMWLEAGSSWLPCTSEGSPSPWGPGDRCSPFITHTSLVPFHSNQAAVMGLSPNPLLWAAAGRGSEPRTRSLRGVALLCYLGPPALLCLPPTSRLPREASAASRQASWRRQ